jgi:hypothetical protein
MPYQERPLLDSEPGQPDPTPQPTPIPPRRRPRVRIIRGEKIGPAFWTVASLISLAVNIILIVALILLGRQLFSLKQLIQGQLVGGLYGNFVKMDQAHIRTSIPLSPLVPAKFDLPLNTTTTVTLTEDTVISKATLYDLDAGNILKISQANLNIILPAGTELPIKLDLTVPVDQQIPVNLVVNVDIPLYQTELHDPFVGLQQVVKPYYTILGDTPNTWQEAVCGPNPSGICPKIFP